jgi:peptide/nickel transport system permease protein
MLNYIVRRLVQAVPQLLIISIILFALMQAFGDPISTLGARTPPRPEDKARLRRQLGLDQPAYVQYLVWLVGNDWMKIDMDGDGVRETPGTRKGILRGDWGNSLVTRRPVLEMIGERLPNTLLLMVTAECLCIAVSLTVGVYSAIHKYSLFDNLITTASFIGYSMPVFWLALMLMYIFAVNFKRWGLPYLPTVGMFDPAVGQTPSELIKHLILPVTTISVITVAGYSRYVRSSMLEVMSQDYIRTARAKGVAERFVILQHALRMPRCRSSPLSAWNCRSCWRAPSSRSASLPGRAWAGCSSTTPSAPISPCSWASSCSSLSRWWFFRSSPMWRIHSSIRVSV